MRKIIGDYIKGLQDNHNPDASTRKSGKRKVINRDREGSSKMLLQHYFAEPNDNIYNDVMFHRRFCMQRELFLCIVGDVTLHDSYFTQRPDVCRVLEFTPLVKCTAAMRILAYGLAYDQVDEYLAIGETTAKDILRHFVEAIIQVYHQEYLRGPNPEEIERLKLVGAQRGLPGMIGSMDCMHWNWKNCQARTPGSCNDINVLDRSPLFDDVLNGTALKCEFHINGHDYDMRYYLTDGIYPEWAAFIPSIHLNRGPKEELFAAAQESFQKVVERAFRVLQAQFHIIRNPAYYWDVEMVGKIIIACVILHNMIVEDERHTYGLHYDVNNFMDTLEEPWEYHTGARTYMTAFLQARFQLHNRENHQQLKNDLIEHLWQYSGPSN